jgi:rRNA pseudouridine-1189 N-methylase Emg1 (Nep1/Mra1 family)
VYAEGDAPEGVDTEGDTSNEVYVEGDAHKEALAVGGMPEGKAEDEVEKGTVITVCGEDLFTDDE